jgi:dATP pyrophosphohydrolase
MHVGPVSFRLDASCASSPFPVARMPESSVRVVDVYPYRLSGDQPEYLLLRRATDTTYAGEWRMVGGKIKSSEAAWETARRELREETGCTPVRFWTVPSVNSFYEWQADRVNLIPAFAAEVSGDIALDDEHDAHAWLSLDDAAERLGWPEQERLLRLTDRLLRDGIPPDLVIE